VLQATRALFGVKIVVIGILINTSIYLRRKRGTGQSRGDWDCRERDRMSYRILIASLAAGVLVIASMATEADARGGARAGGARAGGVHAAGVRGGAVRAGGVHAGGAYRGGAYRGAAVYRGGAYRGGAYVGRGVGAAAVGAAAYGATAYPYYNRQCGYAPYPPCY